jgi:uncharacterized protein YndB with AHSA1/START domain
MKLSHWIAASPERLYAAFMDAAALTAWLPPQGMRGEMLRFEPYEGGGYRMRLTYEGASGRGKTTADADVAEVRFAELIPDERIVQIVTFESDDPDFAGEMRMTWTFAEADGGAEVCVEVESAPAGISEADHETGIRSSLENLARFVSAP